MNGDPWRESGVQQLHRARPNDLMHIAIVVYVLCVTQASVHRQSNELAVTEEVGSAENALESCWWTADGYRGRTKCADKDLAGFRRFLTSSLDWNK